jgi:DMSO/TMAO reductase YedYZ molybdopterin-dependent catalytic subunit
MAVRDALARLAPAPRIVDWSLLALALAALATGLASLGIGDPDGAVVFVLHGVAGVALAALLAVKLRRVAARLRDRRAWDRATPLSILTATVVLLALATGGGWALGATVPLGFWTLLNVHVLFGLLVVPLVLGHLWTRFRPPRRRDLDGRRDALRYAGLALAGAATVRLGDALARRFDTAAAAARFTGSRPLDDDGDGAPDGRGNAAFPVTSWVADDPDPIDPDDWRLRVGGLVDTPLDLGVDDLAPDDAAADGSTPQDPAPEDPTPDDFDPPAAERALLDCTSGWYTVQDWEGIRLGTLLSRAGVRAEGRWVVVRSVTGYRWSFPLSEARGALLATRVGGERLSHGHGYPLRLVVPGRRGFQWVKWVDRVEVRRRRDLGQYVATLVSGF